MQKPATRELIGITLLCLIVAVLFGAMAEKQIDYGLFDDYPKHIGDAERLINNNWQPPFPHFLHAFNMATVAGGNPDNLRRASTIVHIIYYEVMALAIYAILRPMFMPIKSIAQFALVIGAVLSLMMIMPINLLTPYDTLTLYFGYIVPSPYHNPTTILMKSFALLQLPLAIRIFTSQKAASLPVVGLATVITVLAILAKPNYTLALLPAIGLLVLCWQFILKRFTDWRLFLVGFAIPSLPVLFWQYTMAFDTNAELSGGIVFAPFEFFLLVEPELSAIFIKLLLSSLFPLVIVMLYPRRVLQSVPLLLSWGAYLVALVMAYFLNQSGPQFNHGNFIWGSFVALFVLFVYSLLFFVQQNRQPEQRTWRFYAGTGIYFLHVASGIVWFVINLTILYPGTGDPVVTFIGG